MKKNGLKKYLKIVLTFVFFDFFLLVYLVNSQSTFRISYDIASFDLGGGIVVTPANEYVFAGTNASFIPYYGNVVKLDNTGSVLWAKAYTGGIATTFNDLKNVSSGGFITCGQSSSGGAILVRLDNNGNVIWAKRYLLPDINSSKTSNEFFNAVIETSDGGFLAVGGVDYFWDGSSASTVDTTSFFAVKVNSTGNIQWSRVWTISTPQPDESYFWDCAESSDGYLLVGQSADGSQSMTDGDYPTDAFLIKVNKTTGANIFVNRFGNGNSTSQVIYGVITLSSGHFLIGGSDDVHGFVARLQGTGTSVSQLFGRRINGSAFPVTQYVIRNLMENSDGNYSFIGWRVAGLFPTLNSAILKMNSSTGAIMIGKQYAPIGLSAIMPEGGLVPSDQGYFLLNTDQQVTGFNYNLIRTDSNGDIGLSVSDCTPTSINPSTQSYNITFQSITTNSYSIGSDANFSILITNLTPITNVHCLNCNLNIVPTLTANPNPICAGATTTISVTNSQPGFNYNVYTSSTGGTPIGTAPLSVSPVNTTTYYIEVQSQSNTSCVTSTRTPITITVNPSPTLVVNVNPNPLCSGNTLTLSVSGASSYTWTGPSGFTSNASNTTITNISLSNAGTYSVTGEDLGCSSTSVVNVSVHPIPTPTIMSNSPICEGQSINLSALPNSMSSYLWQGPSGFSSSLQNPTILPATLSNSGVYTLTVIDNNGCTGSTTESITVLSIPDISIVPPSTITCSNSTVQLVATTTVSPVSYSWSGAGIQSVIGPGTVIVNQGGNYTVVVQNTLTGCSNSSIISVSTDTTIPTINVSPTTQTISCTTSTAQIVASGNAVTYSWTGTGIQSGGNTATVIVNSPGTYTVIGTGANGCTTAATSTIFPDIYAPTVILSSSSETITCYNPNPSISASTGTMTNVSFSWSPSTGISSGSNSSSATFTAGGNYTLVVTNLDNGCTTSTFVTIYTNTNSPNVSTSISNSITCSNSNATVVAYSMDSNLDYLWNGNGIVSGLGTGTIVVNQGGTFTVNVTNTVTGCSFSTIVDVPVNMNLSMSINGLTSICSGESTTLTVSGANSYTWSTGDNNISIVISPTTTNTYSVIGTLGACTGTAQITVNVSTTPTVTVTPTSSTILISGNVSLSASGANTYSWEPTDGLNNPNIPNPIANPVITTTYCVWGYTSSGCRDSACVTIFVDSRCGELFVPNIFSPNDDNVNDELCVYGTHCIEKDYLFVIYDRWGEKVFETNDKNKCWDGKYNGKLMNNATFVYYLKGIKYDGSGIEKRGNINLIK